MARPAATSQAAIGWRAVFAALTTDAVAILPGFMTAALAVQIRKDIGLSLVELGVSIGVFFGSAAAASPAMGVLVERWGWAKGLRVAAVLAGAGSAGVALMAQSAASLTAVFVVAGVAVAIAHPAANLAVARCVPINRHGLFFGIRQAAAPAATLLGGLAVPVLALTVGWRWAFVGSALLALATAASIPGEESQPVGTAPSPERSTRNRPSTDLRLLVILTVAVGLGIGGIDALASFIVSYSVDIGIAESTAGLILAVGSILGITARVVAGWRIDRNQESDLTAVATMLAVGAAGVIVLNLGHTGGLYVGALVAFVAGWGWSGLFTFAVVRDNPGAPAAATAITQVGKLAGAALGPVAFGWLAGSASYGVAWWAVTAALAGAAAMILYVHVRRGPKPATGSTEHRATESNHHSSQPPLPSIKGDR